MKVLVVEPGYYPYSKEINGLKEMQETVGGIIQAIYPFEDEVAVVCNDEGIILGLPFNRSMPGGYGAVYGTFFICGLGEEDFCSLTKKQMLKFSKKFERAEKLILIDNTPVIIKSPAEKKKRRKKSNDR